MNRVSGDYFENLLYKIFVSTDERTSVEQLSTMLAIDIELVKVIVDIQYMSTNHFSHLLFLFFCFVDFIASSFCLLQIGFCQKKEHRTSNTRT